MTGLKRARLSAHFQTPAAFPWHTRLANNYPSPTERAAWHVFRSIFGYAPRMRSVRRSLFVAAMLSGCTVASPEFIANRDMAPSLPDSAMVDDLASAKDIVAPLTDLSVMSDLVAPERDLRRLDDLSVMPDLAKTPDLRMPPDLLTSPDLRTPPDLALVCPAGYADCNNDASDGCEAALNTSAHCGSCAPCSTANATEACSFGACVIQACSGWWRDCNHSAADGCEVNTQFDPMNCGGCGFGCAPGAFPHASCACSNGTILLGPCDSGWSNCDGDPWNGCEKAGSC